MVVKKVAFWGEAKKKKFWYYPMFAKNYCIAVPKSALSGLSRAKGMTSIDFVGQKWQIFENLTQNDRFFWEKTLSLAKLIALLF